MTKLKTEQEYKFGQKRILPFIGEVQISNEGFIELEDEQIAQQIEDLEIGFTIVGKVSESSTITHPVKVEEIKPKVEVDTLSSLDKKEEEIKPQTTESTTVVDSITQVAAQEEVILENLTVDKLRELAAPFPKEEWNTLKKVELITYIKTQLEKVK